MHRINNIQFNSCKVCTRSIITKYIITFMLLWYLLTERHKFFLQFVDMVAHRQKKKKKLTKRKVLQEN